MTGWVGQKIQTDWTDMTTQMGQAGLNDPYRSGGPDDPDGPG